MQLAQIFRSVDCGACITEVHGETFPLVWSNPRFEDMTGFSSAQMEGHDPWEMHTGLCSVAEQKMKWRVAQQKGCRGIIQIRRADGSPVWLEVTGRPANDGDQRLFGMIDDLDPDVQKALATLSPRQEEFFALLANSVRVKSAAQMMGLSLRTAQRYREQILDRLRIEDFSELYVLQR